MSWQHDKGISACQLSGRALLAREAINELESHATLQILNLVAHPGQAKVVMGMAKLMLFLKLSEPGQFK